MVVVVRLVVRWLVVVGNRKRVLSCVCFCVLCVFSCRVLVFDVF